MALKARKKRQFFFARAFGAREALSRYFGGGRAQKQGIRKPTGLTLCSLWEHLWLICDLIDARKVKLFFARAYGARGDPSVSSRWGTRQKVTLCEPVRLAYFRFLLNFLGFWVSFVYTRQLRCGTFAKLPRRNPSFSPQASECFLVVSAPKSDRL